MKKYKLFTTLIASVILLASCNNNKCELNEKPLKNDYVGQVSLERSFEGMSFLDNGIGEVTLRTSVDGDTAHFYDKKTNLLIKARFLGVDTPESTGKVERWGKQASNFTRSKLEGAFQIVLSSESDANQSAALDGNGRQLAFIWVRGEDDSKFRLLNLWIVQEGYSAAKSAESRYNDVFVNAENQAKKAGRYYWADTCVVDPLYPKDEVIETTIMDLAIGGVEVWDNVRVRVEGVVARMVGIGNAYLQEVFHITDEHGDPVEVVYGIYVFTGYRYFAPLSLNYRVSISGLLSSFMGNLQMTDVSYSPNLPNPERDMYVVLDEDGKPDIDNEIFINEMTIAQLNDSLYNDPTEYINTLVHVTGLHGTGGYGGLDEFDRNGNPNSSNAMSVYIEDADGNEFQMRIDNDVAITDRNNELRRIRSYTYFAVEGDVYDLIGVVSLFAPDEANPDDVVYQIKLLGNDDIIFH